MDGGSRIYIKGKSVGIGKFKESSFLASEENKDKGGIKEVGCWLNYIVICILWYTYIVMW